MEGTLDIGVGGGARGSDVEGDWGWDGDCGEDGSGEVGVASSSSSSSSQESAIGAGGFLGLVVVVEVERVRDWKGLERLVTGRNA